MKHNAFQPRARLLLCRNAEQGQSIVESCMVIVLVCLIFFGFLQVAVLYNHERVLQFASFAAARSAAVGFNEDVYTRAYRAASIPASGRMLSPESGRSQPEQLATEQADIPLYLNPQNNAGFLLYEFWDPYDMRPNIQAQSSIPAIVQEYHNQTHPLTLWQDSSMLSALYGKTTVDMANQTTLANHSAYYLQ